MGSDIHAILPDEGVVRQRKLDSMSLARKYQKIIHRSWLVIRIPNAMTADLCNLMECKHDHPRRVAMAILREGIKRKIRRLDRTAKG